MRPRQMECLECTGCGALFDFPNNHFCHYSYADISDSACGTHTTDRLENIALDDRVNFLPMLLSPCWCIACNWASLVEHLPSMQEFMNAEGLRRLAQDSIHDEVEVLWRSNEEPVCDIFEDELLWVTETHFKELFALRAKRASLPRCVVCASHSVIKLDRNERQTALRHDACYGSPIILCGPSVGGGSYKEWQDIYYDTEGRFLYAWGAFSFSSPFASFGRTAFVIGMLNAYPRNRKLAAAAYLFASRNSGAVKQLELLASEGVASAAGMLGLLHCFGKLGATQDGKLGIGLLMRAVEQGDGFAAHNLAEIYSTGAPDIVANPGQCETYHRLAREMGAPFRLRKGCR